MLRHDPLYPPRLVCPVTCLISLDYTDMPFSLTTWLSHSKKKTCDVCKHPYSFTKGKVSLVNPGPAQSNFPLVYANDMPRDLPVILLLRKLIQQVVFACFFCIRAIIVSFVWLAILPWVVFLSWRVYFSLGNCTYVTVPLICCPLLMSFVVLRGLAPVRDHHHHLRHRPSFTISPHAPSLIRLPPTQHFVAPPMTPTPSH